MPDPTPIKLTLVNSLDALSEIEAAINQICEVNKVERRYWHRCRLVAEELFVNIVNHGFDDGIAGVVKWSVWMTEGKIHFSITDNGRAFTPPNPKPLAGSLDEIDNVGGHGTGLIEKMTSRIQYSRDSQGNRCEVTMDALNA